MGHQYKNKETHVFVVKDKGGELRTEEEDGVTDSLGLEIDEIVELSINSVVGLLAPKTMKVKERIAQQEVVVMVDSSAIHNFISTKLIQKLAISVERTTGYTDGH